jgi:cytochrome c peroxidase
MSNVAGSIVSSNPAYTSLWESAFPGEDVSDELAGLAIAAYERTILANRAPFQRWLKGEHGAMTAPEKRGALVFFGKGACANCHAGPALSQTKFYALGMPDMRGAGVIRPPGESLGRGDFVPGPETDFHFKVPQLYNLADSPFHGHGGTFESVREVVDYYADGRPARMLPDGTVTGQFHPLDLTAAEIDDLVAFLTNALRDPDLERYVPASVPSGGCIPANDPAARRDLGCD